MSIPNKPVYIVATFSYDSGKIAQNIVIARDSIDAVKHVLLKDYERGTEYYNDRKVWLDSYPTQEELINGILDAGTFVSVVEIPTYGI